MASRVDVYADTQGWTPTVDDFDRLLTRATRRTLFADDVLLHRQLRLVGRRISGFVFGGGPLMARIYDKTLELKRRQADWPATVWQGVDPDAPVWRIEFQFRRDALRTFAIETVADVLSSRQALWDYATGRWLELRTNASSTCASVMTAPRRLERAAITAWVQGVVATPA